MNIPILGKVLSKWHVNLKIVSGIGYGHFNLVFDTN